VRRDLNRLASSEFDLLVVGGGIYGVAAAWDATQRGLRVALIDKGDFGAATSFNNAKTVHGGVRSLQRGHIGEMREYLRERRALSHILPHLVHPLPFLLPTYRHPLQHRWAVGLYFTLNDLLARDRNALDDPSKHLPPSRLVSREECLRLHPAVRDTGLTGGVVWYDAQFSNSDRAALAFVTTAVREGCAAANYVEATGLMLADGRVHGVLARDAMSGETFHVRARSVLLAAGGWTDEWLRGQLPGARRLVPAWSVAMNVVTRPIAGSHAVGGKARGRLFFLAPWGTVTIAGTSHDPWTRGPGAVEVNHDNLARLMADLNEAFPGIGLDEGDIRLVHRGLLPASAATSQRVTLLRTSPVTDHRADGATGLVSLVGVRYTTARQSAQQAIDLVASMLNRTLAPCATATTRLEGGDITRFDDYCRDSRVAAPDVPQARLDRLVRSYGTTHTRVLALMRESPALAAPLGQACDVTGAEVVHAMKHEMAVCLSDGLLRRTEAGTRGHPGADAVQAASILMARVLDWTEPRRLEEVAVVEGTYRLPAELAPTPSGQTWH
jgi:glycerol-3-phosphate dehydrogenase